MNQIIQQWNSTLMLRTYKLIFLLLLISSAALGQIRPDGIRLTYPGFIIGPNGDTIRNTAPNVWSFSNDTLKNAIVSGLETVSLAKYTYWVSPNFPNTGKFFKSIQTAIDSSVTANNDSNRVTIIIFPGNYKGFNCTKSYITFLGLGDVRIDSNLNSAQMINFTGTEIKMKNITITDRRLAAYVDVPYFRVLYTTGTMDLENVNIKFTRFVNVYNLSDVEFVGFAFQNTSGKIKLKNCEVYTKIFIDQDPPFGNPSYSHVKSILISGYSDVSFYADNCKIYSKQFGSEFISFKFYGFWVASPTSLRPYAFFIKNSEVYNDETEEYGYEPSVYTDTYSIKSDSYVNIFGLISNKNFSLDTLYNSTYNVLIDPNYKSF